MSKITLCLAFHNHQPVGNFPWIFESSYRASYLPMLEALERHPDVRVSLHYTGPLYDWLEANQPAFLDRLATLVARGQVEMLTGGYYEPILPSIPESDRLGQIHKMTEYVKNRFGTQTTGMWLAERVWEPQLAFTLPNAGVQWTIVDDTHFKMTGLTDDDLFGYYVTEDQGNTLKVFATSKRLRYVIPWSPVDQVMSELRSWATEEGDLVAVMGDDGEKFGVWPGTYDYCWTNGWIDNFFQAVSQSSSWLDVMPVGEWAAAHPARGRVYLPTASYAEMLEWALPASAAVAFASVFHKAEAEHREDVTRFLRGGFWRNFIVKYDEVNTMHKKMLRAHRKTQSAEAKLGRPDDVALDELWKSQCNCPYWHGVFGGVYMTDVRTATFQHLIRSERRSDEINHGEGPWISAESVDFDCDTRDEIIVDSGQLELLLDPERGGSLFAWDARRIAHNFVSVMTRREEAYHVALRQAVDQAHHSDDSEGTKSIHNVVRLKEAGLEKLLQYDWYRRACLIDHFLGDGVTAEDFARCVFEELGDFVNGRYEPSIDGDSTNQQVTLTRSGHVWYSGEHVPVTVEKIARFGASEPGFEVAYRLVNGGQSPITVKFGVELNLNLLGGGGNPAAFRRFGSDGPNERFDAPAQGNEVEVVSVGNSYLGVAANFSVDHPATAWWSSIDTVSSSEGGFERVHQGSTLLFSWPISLAPSETWQLTLRAAVAT